MTPDYRAELVTLMQETLLDERIRGDWTYRAVRPMPVPFSWRPGQWVTGDCSKGVQYLCRWAGTHDPMGRNYDPYGNSQTLWSNLQSLDQPNDLLPGDIVTFGYNGDDHAAMVLEPSADPVLWSFGHQGAPNTYRLSYDTRPKQYRRNPLPVHVPTPEERLRAMTGWFAWVAWRLGEGDWRTYGKLNPRVRPDVPKMIPPDWWKRYADFLRNRKHPTEKGTPWLAASRSSSTTTEPGAPR